MAQAVRQLTPGEPHIKAATRAFRVLADSLLRRKLFSDRVSSTTLRNHAIFQSMVGAAFATGDQT